MESKEVEAISSALDTIGSSGSQEVELSIGSVLVHKCKVRDIGSVLKLVMKILECMKIDSLTLQPELDISSPVVILRLMSESLDTTKDAMVRLCSLSPQQFDDLDLEDLVPLLTKAWDINKVFFYQTLIPMIQMGTPVLVVEDKNQGEKRERKSRRKK